MLLSVHIPRLAKVGSKLALADYLGINIYYSNKGTDKSWNSVAELIWLLVT